MSDFPKRKVFISWSKRPTDAVASALAALLRHMFDNVEPWVSRDDIDSGSLSIAEIHKELAETTFGILIVTTRNQAEPWLNFEAGSLAKTVVDGTATRVVPLLVDMTGQGELAPGPIANLQAEIATEGGVRRIVNLIGAAVGADRTTLDGRWPAAWKTFDAVLAGAKKQLSEAEPKAEPRSTEDMLAELLALSRRRDARDRGRSAPQLKSVAQRVEESPGSTALERALDDANIRWSSVSSTESGKQVTATVELREPLADDQRSWFEQLIRLAETDTGLLFEVDFEGGGETVKVKS